MATEIDKLLLHLEAQRHLNLIVYIGNELEELFERKNISKEMIDTISIAERKDDDGDSYTFKLNVYPKIIRDNSEKIPDSELYDIRDEAFDLLTLLDGANTYFISKKISDGIEDDGFGEFTVKEGFKDAFIKAMLNEELFLSYQYMTLNNQLGDKDIIKTQKKPKL